MPFVFKSSVCWKLESRGPGHNSQTSGTMACRAFSPQIGPDIAPAECARGIASHTMSVQDLQKSIPKP